MVKSLKRNVTVAVFLDVTDLHNDTGAKFCVFAFFLQYLLNHVLAYSNHRIYFRPILYIAIVTCVECTERENRRVGGRERGRARGDNDTALPTVMKNCLV